MLYQGKFSGSFLASERKFWFNVPIAAMSSSLNSKLMISKFSAKWFGLARGMVIKSR